MEKYMPYIVTVVCALISGIASYAAARRQAKLDIEKIEKQHEVDLDALERTHKMEIERMELEHKHQLELKSKEFEASMGSVLMSEVMKMPEVRQAFSQGMRKGKK